MTWLLTVAKIGGHPIVFDMIADSSKKVGTWQCFEIDIIVNTSKKGGQLIVFNK